MVWELMLAAAGEEVLSQAACNLQLLEADYRLALLPHPSPQGRACLLPGWEPRKAEEALVGEPPEWAVG